MAVIGQLMGWLGPRRARLLLALLVGTVLTVVGLQFWAGDEGWVLAAQLAAVWLFLAGTTLVLSLQLTGRGRKRLWLALGPGLLLLALGIALPDMALFFGGGGLGWMVAAQFVLRSRVRMEYQVAVRHLRQGNIGQAIAVMNDLIDAEPDEPAHFRFRAELHRLANQLHKARSDYERVIKLAPADATGYTGMAEVLVQRGDYEQARHYAQQAFERAPRQWLTAYNLGLIADRLHDPEAAVEHLSAAMRNGLPHSRYHLLTQLWLARNHLRTENEAGARHALDAMQSDLDAVQDWDMIFESEQAAALRDLLQADVRLAHRLLQAEDPLSVLRDEQGNAG